MPVLSQTIEDFEYAVEDGRLRDFLGVDNVPTPLPTPPMPTPKPKPTPVVPSPPPPGTISPSDATTGTEPSATLPLSASSAAEPGEPSLGSSTTRTTKAEDDELLESVGEDELEKLLREMEAEGI